MIYNQAITEAARRADLAFLSPGREFLSRWFGLSYAAWLTMPRVLMEAMPDEWQGKMAALLSEYDAAFPNQPDLGTRVFVTRGGRLVKTPDWLINYRRPDVGKVDELRGSDVAGKEQL